MDVITSRLERLNVNVVNSCALSLSCDCHGSFECVTLSYQVGSPFAESPSDQVAYVNNFQPMSSHDPYSNTYNPNEKNHPNLFYMSDHLRFPQAHPRSSPPTFQKPTFVHKLHRSQPKGHIGECAFSATKAR